MEPEHRLVIGPTWPDLESALAEEVLILKDKDPLRPVVILVGSNLLKKYLSRSLAQRDRVAGLNLRFVTFIELAANLSRIQGDRDTAPELPRLGRELLMRELALRMPEDDYFHPVSDTRGFWKTALDTYRDIKDSRIEAALGSSGLDKAAEWFEKGSGKKLKDFFRLVSLFDEEREGFIMDHDRYEGAIKNAARFQKIFSADILLIYGFYDFTATQWSLIAALAGSLKVTAFMPCRLGSNIFAFADKTRQRFEDIGFSQEEKISEASGKSNLETLKKYYGAGQKIRVPEEGDDSFKVIAAAGEDREVRAIAREIMRLVKEREFRFHEIGIILRNRDLYQPLFEEIFADCGIPLFTQKPGTLANSPVGRTLLILLNLAGSRFPRNQVMEFLCSGKWNIHDFFPGAKPDLPFRFDSISREAGVVEGKQSWLKRLAALEKTLQSEIQAREDSGELRAGARSEKAQTIKDMLGFLSSFFSDIDGLQEKTTWKDLTENTIELAKKYILVEENELNGLEGPLKELAELDRIHEDKKVDLDLFREMLGCALENFESEKEHRYQEGCVCLSDLMPARGVRFRALFIPGLVEKSFPQHVREDPIILDEERKKINTRLDLKGSFLPVKREQINEELLLFFLALNQAEERLILTWPRLDLEKNRERVPSFFLLRSLETLAGRRLKLEDLKDQKTWVRILGLSRFAADDENECLDESDRDLLRTSQTLEHMEPAIGSYLAEVNPFLERGASSMDSRLRVGTLTRFDGYILSKNTEAILEKQFQDFCQRVSPSRLEAWATCPFRYFLERVLGLGIREDPEEIVQISALDRGTFMHHALENFFKKLAQEGGLPIRKNDPEKLRTEIESEILDISKDYEDRGLTGVSMIWEIDRQEIIEDLSNVIHHEIASGEVMIPEEFEQRFEVPLSIDDEHELTVAGKVDRLDTARSGVRVIDYKSGKVPEGLAENRFVRGQALQLPIYLYAALTLKNIEDPGDSWAEYFFISKRGKFRRVRFEGADWPEKLGMLKEIISIILSGIRGGLFMPWQEKCDNCDYRLACFRPGKHWIEKKTGDEKAGAFPRLQGFK